MNLRKNLITEVSGVRLDRDRAEEDAEIRQRRHAGDGAGDVDEAPKIVMISIMSPLQIVTIEEVGYLDFNLL